MHARIASLLDDIISRTPVGRTLTVASLLAKAFIATAVPETLSSLEAWHLLWQLPRTVRSRFFKPLNMDGVTSLKMPAEVAREDADLGEGPQAEAKKRLAKATPIEQYRDRMQIPCKDPALADALEGYSLYRFVSELNVNDTGICRMKRPRVVNVKPYLQLDLKRPTAVKHARMALRLLRPWHGAWQDPLHLPADEAVAALEAFVASGEEPRWFIQRFEQHNR